MINVEAKLRYAPSLGRGSGEGEPDLAERVRAAGAQRGGCA